MIISIIFGLETGLQGATYLYWIMDDWWILGDVQSFYLAVHSKVNNKPAMDSSKTIVQQMVQSKTFDLVALLLLWTDTLSRQLLDNKALIWRLVYSFRWYPIISSFLLWEANRYCIGVVAKSFISWSVFNRQKERYWAENGLLKSKSSLKSTATLLQKGHRHSNKTHSNHSQTVSVSGEETFQHIRPSGPFSCNYYIHDHDYGVE